MSPEPGLPWRRLGAEFLVIVTGVLMALGVQAWWDGQVERGDEVEALRNLRDDFTETAELLESAGATHLRIRGSATRLLAMTGPIAPSVIPELTVDSLLMHLISGPTVNPVTATFDALVGSGRLDIVSNAELRRELAGWSAASADLADIEREARAQMDQRFLPMIWDYVPVVTLDFNVLSTYRESGLEPSRFTRRYSEMLTSRRFENAVEERMNSSRVASRELLRAERLVGRILELVDSELSR